jgi:hypothetical protein
MGGVVRALLLGPAAAACVRAGREEAAEGTEDACAVVARVHDPSGAQAAFALLVERAPGVAVMRGEAPARAVAVALFPDGTCWRGADPSLGGPPYEVRRVAPERVAAFARDAFERIDALAWVEPYVIPDAGWAELVVRGGERETCLVSCALLFEANPELVALSTGVTALDGRSREEALAGEPEAWLALRAAWSELSARARALAAEGEPLPDASAPRSLEIRRPGLPPWTLAR